MSVKKSLLVAAAGNGTRMGTNLPKALMPIGNDTLVEFSTRVLAQACDDAVIIVKSNEESLFAARLRLLNGLSISFCYQDHPNGTADAVLRGLREVQSDFALIVWADHLGAGFIEHNELEKVLALKSAEVVVPVVWKSNPYAYFKIVSGSVVAFGETRRGAPMLDMGWSDCGFFLVRTAPVLRELEELVSASEEDQNFLSLLPRMSSRGLAIETVELTNHRLTCGANTPAEIAYVAELLLEE